MATISATDVNAWLDGYKLTINQIDANGLEPQIVAQVFSRLAPVYDVSLWSNETNTPALVKSIISMIYAGRIYQRAYAEDDNSVDSYGSRLIADANTLIESIVATPSVIVGTEALKVAHPAVAIAAEVLETEPYFTMGREW